MVRINPKYVKKSGIKAQLTNDTVIHNLTEAETETIKSFCSDFGNESGIKSISSVIPIPSKISEKVTDESGKEFITNEEGFVITFDGCEVIIYADSKIGVQNGVMTFLQSLDSEGCYSDEILWDYPICSLRGIKVMMPARNEIDDFKQFVDMMAYFRHNTIMIEVGGAMEYKRHPEINEGWEEYCEFMTEYSGKSKKIQEFTYPWRKNSIHCNNGGGSYLTQEEVKDIIAYCNSRNIKVIPEVPCTSHCDYLLIRHPELAERPEDPYPDTFCPSNPASYELLFDVLDEVIEVFKPEILDIGHDEYYSINVCDRCRKRIIDNSDLLAEDINKIHDYLAAHNVKTMMWCDMLMNVEEGTGRGGALTFMYFAWDIKNYLMGIIRPTWEARNKVPKDIICMNWFMDFGEKYDEQIREFSVVFGNFWGQLKFRNFKRRAGNNTIGGMCSNWGATTDIYFQHNNVYASMAYNEIYYWDDSYDDNNDSEYALRVNRMFESVYNYRYRTLLNKRKNYIEVVHTTDKFVRYREFSDGVFPDGKEFRNQYYLGDYVITFDDGTTQTEEIFYGQHIINKDIKWYAKGEESEAASVDAAPGMTTVRLDQGLSSVAGPTLPLYIDGKIYCRYLIESKYPEKKVREITFRHPENADWKVEIKSTEVH